MGPTGSGKTELAMKLAAALNVELVSVDSALVYRGMDIGTAKPSLAERKKIPHHLIDIKDPSEQYSAGEFRRDALRAMRAICEKGKVPLLVGGTFLYFKALSEGIARLPEANAQIRANLDAQAAISGWPDMHGRLTAIDPLAASRIHPNDSQRIQRALEVFELTGVALSTLQNAAIAGGPGPFRYVRIGLIPPNRVELNSDIEKRFKSMLERGLLAEVATLLKRPELHPDLPAMRAVGYRQLAQHLAGDCDLEEATRRAIVATRRLAKRQMTWLRGEQFDGRFEPGEADLAAKIARFLASTAGWTGGPIC